MGSPRDAGGISASCCCFLGVAAQLAITALQFSVLCLPDGSLSPFAPTAQQLYPAAVWLPENRSPSQMQHGILQLLKTLAFGPANTKRAQIHTMKCSTCLNAWLGRIRTHHFVGLSHYLCCNTHTCWIRAPCRAAGGEGSGISRILAKLGSAGAMLTLFFPLCSYNYSSQTLFQELQIPLTSFNFFLGFKVFVFIR